MKINRYSGLAIGLLLFIVLSLVAQSGFATSEASGFFGYLQNSTLLFNFTSLLIPAMVSSVLFPSGGVSDIYMIMGFSFIQFSLIGYLVGKIFEPKK